MSSDTEKEAAAEYAAGLVENGMLVGLGTGTTAVKMVDALGRRVRDGLNFVGVPSSERTAEQARTLGILLRTLEEAGELDLYIDGADEVDPNLDLVKGHGGALMREKLVTEAARRFVVMVDESKLVESLGQEFPIPIEVVTFGWGTTQRRLEALGLSCELRGGRDNPYLTDNHNYILDCRVTDTRGRSTREIADAIKLTTGVVDHGYFLGMASVVVIGKPSGDVDVRTRA
jgi:ribose 5-phosphate isomerase A